MSVTWALQKNVSVQLNFISFKAQERETLSPVFESLMSEATVVETTSQVFDAVDDDTAGGSAVDDDTAGGSTALRSSSVDAMRSRKGSYTLDHPSPSLVAYMNRTGRSGMETPR